MRGYYRAAIEKYAPLAEHDATRLDATLGIADCDEQEGRYAEALERLESIRQLGEGSAGWHEAVARFHRHLGRYAEAADAYRAALRCDEAHFAARLGLGETLETLGRKQEAAEVYAWFDQLLRERMPERADELTYAARGLYRFTLLSRHPNLVYRTRYVLQELLQPAYERIDRTYWPARLAAAELLLSRYNTREAKADFEAARKLNTNLADAYVGLGWIGLEKWDFDEAERRVRASLELNPNHIGAMHLLIETRGTERKYREAADEAKKAIEINPNDPYTLSLAAAAHIRMGDADKARAFQDRVAEVSPHCGLMHFVIAEWLSAARQFPEAEQQYRKAIDLDPEDSRPRTALGLMYMQWGKEAEAREVLDEAWAFDRFNRQTYNMLELLDDLERFDRYESAHFTIHYDAEQDAVIAPYFADYMEGIYDGLCEDYGFEPPDKTIIEVFPDHRQFAVRITGKPWIHTIGASTGRVIAMDAPRSTSAGNPFNWERVLRHEFTHTVTLAATRNRIPHWFTEGLAVMQEDAPRWYRWQKKLAARLRLGQLFTLESIDWGFIRPRRSDDREMAYAQSEWMCEYLIGRYGYGIVNKMIAAFRDAKTQGEVFREVVKIEPEAFTEAFETWAAKEVRSWGLSTEPVESALKLKALLLLKPKDASLHGRLAETLMLEEDYDGAHEAADKALKLDPNNVNALEVMARFLMAAAERAEGDQRAKVYGLLSKWLERLVKADPTSPTPPEVFGKLAVAREQYDEAVTWFERLKRLRPAHPASYRGLAAIHLKRNEPDKALPALLELWRLDENDAAMPLEIARIFEAKPGREADAILWYRRTIAIDPYAPEPHVTLAKLCERTKRWNDAAREHRALCALEPTEAKHHANLAFAYEKAGDMPKAKTAANRAVELDPSSPARRLLSTGEPDE